MAWTATFCAMTIATGLLLIGRPAPHAAAHIPASRVELDRAGRLDHPAADARTLWRDAYTVHSNIALSAPTPAADAKTPAAAASAAEAAPADPRPAARPQEPVARASRAAAPYADSTPTFASTSTSAQGRPASSTVSSASPVAAVLTTPADESRAARAVTVTPAVAREDATLVTVTGCLDADGGHYRLKHVEGDNAPRTRSWKTGFLTRRSAPLDVTGGWNVNLPAHVNQQVALTGTLADKDLQVQSIRRLATSCR
jgi:hypothetical protein